MTSFENTDPTVTKLAAFANQFKLPTPQGVEEPTLPQQQLQEFSQHLSTWAQEFKEVLAAELDGPLKESLDFISPPNSDEALLLVDTLDDLVRRGRHVLSQLRELSQCHPLDLLPPSFHPPIRLALEYADSRDGRFKFDWKSAIADMTTQYLDAETLIKYAKYRVVIYEKHLGDQAETRSSIYLNTDVFSEVSLPRRVESSDKGTTAPSRIALLLMNKAREDFELETQILTSQKIRDYLISESELPPGISRFRPSYTFPLEKVAEGLHLFQWKIFVVQVSELLSDADSYFKIQSGEFAREKRQDVVKSVCSRVAMLSQLVETLPWNYGSDRFAPLLTHARSILDAAKKQDELIDSRNCLMAMDAKADISKLGDQIRNLSIEVIPNAMRVLLDFAKRNGWKRLTRDTPEDS